jgi:hypothetical protein
MEDSTLHVNGGIDAYYSRGIFEDIENKTLISDFREYFCLNYYLVTTLLVKFVIRIHRSLRVSM